MYLVTIRVTICHRLSGLGRDLSRSGPYFAVRAGCRCQITFWEFFSFSSSSSLLTGLLVEMVAKDEGDTEEEQQEVDQEDQGELLLQVGHPAGLATIFNFIQPVGRASSLSCSSHRGYKHCSLDARQGWGSSHGLDEKATTVVSLKYKETTVVAFFAVPVNIKWRSWTNDRFVCAITHSV